MLGGGGGNGYIVQEVLKQHESFSKYNSSSVNVVRITTLFWKGEVYVLGHMFRVGAPGSFCDLGITPEGNYARLIGLDSEGRLTGKFIEDVRYNLCDDCYGVPPSGVIPKFSEMKELAVKEHSRYPHCGIIGWDFTLDEHENITCIEFNSMYPGVFNMQCVCGPIFMQKSSRGVPLLYEILAERK